MYKPSSRRSNKDSDRDRDRHGKEKGKRKYPPRMRSISKFTVGKEVTFDYKNIALLQKFINDRGKVVSRRVSEVSARQQRQLNVAIKRARFLGLISVGGIRK